MGTEVIQLIQIILEESDIAIKNAYEEGYKEAYLQLQPEIDYWKAMYDSKTKELKSTKLKNFSIGFLSGLAIPGTISLILSLKF